MDTERPSSRVTFSRGDDNTTRQFDPMDAERTGLAESASLPNLSGSSTKAQRRKKRRKSWTQPHPFLQDGEEREEALSPAACILENKSH